MSSQYKVFSGLMAELKGAEEGIKDISETSFEYKVFSKKMEYVLSAGENIFKYNLRGMKAKKFKVIVVGGRKVGKTSYLNNLVGESFTYDYTRTKEIEYQTIQYLTNKGPFELMMWDFPHHLSIKERKERSEVIPAEEKITLFAEQEPKSIDGYRGMKAAIVMYDVTNKNSVEEALLYINKIRETPKCENIPIILCANKCECAVNKIIEPTLEDDKNIYKMYISTKEGTDIAGSKIIPKYRKSPMKSRSVGDKIYMDSIHEPCLKILKLLTLDNLEFLTPCNIEKLKYYLDPISKNFCQLVHSMELNYRKDVLYVLHNRRGFNPHSLNGLIRNKRFSTHKVSELIKTLTELKTKYGDLDVMYWDTIYEDNENTFGGPSRIGVKKVYKLKKDKMFKVADGNLYFGGFNDGTEEVKTITVIDEESNEVTQKILCEDSVCEKKMTSLLKGNEFIINLHDRNLVDDFILSTSSLPDKDEWKELGPEDKGYLIENGEPVTELKTSTTLTRLPPSAALPKEVAELSSAEGSLEAKLLSTESPSDFLKTKRTNPSQGEEFPPGRYWLGDPYYALSPKMYNLSVHTADEGYMRLKGKYIAKGPTYLKNGNFTDTDGEIMCVIETGTLAIIGHELVENELYYTGQLFDLEHPFTFIFKDGVFKIITASKGDSDEREQRCLLTINTQFTSFLKPRRRRIPTLEDIKGITEIKEKEIKEGVNDLSTNGKTKKVKRTKKKESSN